MPPETAKDDFYAVLKITPQASTGEIQDAARLQRRHWNNRANNAPDDQDRFEAKQMVKLIDEAEKTLTDTNARQLYDAQRGRGAGGDGRIAEPIAPFVPGRGGGGDGPRIVEPIAPVVPGGGGRGGGRSAPGFSSQLGGHRMRRLTAWARAHPRKAIASIVVVIIVIAAANSAHGGGKPTTANTSSSWPSGATRSAVLAPVVAALKSCAQAATAQPANCPQQGISANTIIWALYGDPSEGALISYSSGTFTVVGNAVMTEHYEDPSLGNGLKVLPTAYQATVAWNKGHPQLTALASPQSPPAITVPRPAVTDQQVEAAVAQAFNACLAANSLTLPVRCVSEDFSGDSFNSPTSIVWHSTQNPLLNAAVTYDSSSGILHVVASYAISVTWTDSNGSESQQDSGNYDAQVVDNNGSLTVLKIAKAS
jgi:hypothetical protein